MPDIGVPELLIIALIVVLLFGPGKVADIGGSLGKGIREFRRVTREDDDAPGGAAANGSAPPATGTPPALGDAGAANGAVSTPGAARVRFCTECGGQVREGQKFCTSCGTAVTAGVT